MVAALAAFEVSPARADLPSPLQREAVGLACRLRAYLAGPPELTQAEQYQEASGRG